MANSVLLLWISPSEKPGERERAWLIAGEPDRKVDRDRLGLTWLVKMRQFARSIHRVRTITNTGALACADSFG